MEKSPHLDAKINPSLVMQRARLPSDDLENDELKFI